MNKIKGTDGIKNAARYLSVNADIKEKSGDSIALTVTTNDEVSVFAVIDGEQYNEKSEDGIWLSDKYAAANDIKLGNQLTFQYKGIEICGTVKGLIKAGEHLICVQDETQLMPDYTIHGFAYISTTLYEKSMGIDFYPQINVLSELSKKDFIIKVDEALGYTALILTREETISYSGASGETEEGPQRRKLKSVR